MIKYTYQSAATELHPGKQGVNRSTWNDNASENKEDWTEITREYFPVDPRETENPITKILNDLTDDQLLIIKQKLNTI